MSTMALTILCLSLAAFFGLILGHIKFKGVSLGIGGVLFSGLIVGHYANSQGWALNGEALDFMREFGLILFVYMIGMQVGPGFFAALKRNGLLLNALAVFIVLGGSLIAVLLFKTADLDLPTVLGLYSGAVTNTPALGAAQQVLTDMNIAGAQYDVDWTGMAYAMAYPLGIGGILLTIVLIRFALKIDLAQEIERYEDQKEQRRPEVAGIDLIVGNQDCQGVEIGRFSEIFHQGVVVSRMKRDGKFIVPHLKTKLQVGDVLHLVGPVRYFATLQELFRAEQADNLIIDSAAEINAHKLLVTNPALLGAPLDVISGREGRDWVISRVTRNGRSFPATPDFKLAFGDEVTAVSRPSDILPLVRLLGNDRHELEKIRLIPMFLGIALGVLLGSLSFFISGVSVPIRLGLAGGPLVVSLILAAKGYLGRMIFYMPYPASTALREFGIVMFLSVVGITSGAQFFALLSQGNGLMLIGYGFLITFIPLVLAALIGRCVFGINYLTLSGMLAGTMTDPPALAFANEMSGSDAASVGYATVYPLTMCLRILAPQVMALMLF